MTKRILIRTAALLAFAVGVFALGVRVGSDLAARPQIYVGSGYVGSEVASLQAGDTVFGLRSSVRWTDATGVARDGGWPDCLPPLHEVTGIRFAGEVRWIGDIGLAEVVWVDCTAR